VFRESQPETLSAESESAMQETQMKAILRAAQQKLLEQDALLRRLTSSPLVYATVLQTGSKIEKVPQPWEKGDTVSFGEDGRTSEVKQVDPSGRLLVDGYPVKSLEWVDPRSSIAGIQKKAKIGDVVTLHSGRSGSVTHIDPHDGWYNVEFTTDQQQWIDPAEVGDKPPKDVERSFAVVVFEGKMLEVDYPDELTLVMGDTVRLSPETMQIVDKVESFEAIGEVATVRLVLNDRQVEVDYQGNNCVVFVGNCGEVEKGDRVILDATSSVLLHNLGKNEERFTVTQSTNVTWGDIGGLEQAKEQMIEAIELPHLQADLYRFYGKKPVKGILLYGPPGCGKTMLGKAAATSLANLYGSSVSSGFFYVKGPEMLDKFVGNTEAAIRKLFERARKHKLEHGYPAVIFFDEADALMGTRGTGISSDIRDTIVPMLLTEMDGLDESGALIILATNRPDILDPAIVRDGRVDRKVKVTRPLQDDATKIFQLYLDGIPLNNGYTVSELAQSASAELFSSDRVLYTIHLRGETSLDFHFHDVTNGAMIAGIVDQATSKALRRDMQTGSPAGLCHSDLVEAVEEVFGQNKELDHKDELRDFTEDFRDDILNIHRFVGSTS
jgi:proteasome ATPase